MSVSAVSVMDWTVHVLSGLLRDELRGSSSEHGGLLLYSDAHNQTPSGLRPVLQPQRAEDWQLTQPGGNTQCCWHVCLFPSRRQYVFTLCPSVLSQRAQAALRALSSSHVDAAVAAPSTVLRVVVENLVYPVTLDALCQVTSTRHNWETKRKGVQSWRGLTLKGKFLWAHPKTWRCARSHSFCGSWSQSNHLKEVWHEGL